MSVVAEMLQLARAGPGDYVIDLGSGDGRLVLEAVTHFGVRKGLGVDLDPHLVRYANGKAREAGVTSRARFEVRDLFDTDVHDATVVTVYLLPGIMGKLQDKLLAELPAGSRVVSHDYVFPSWPVERVRSFDGPEKNDTGRRSTSVYLYTVPARPQGEAPARS
jgi:SAM-dependent methyltransferase